LPESFSNKLERAFSKHGQLCVGIDPHDELLIENGFEVSVFGLREFSLKILEQLAGAVSIIKPQVSFFERFGSRGFIVLEEVLALANEQGFLVIADAKRGDIGSTMEAYSNAWLAQGAPFVCDALTLNPYLGVRSLIPAISLANERGKGLFILSATSNPDGEVLQGSQHDGISVSGQIAKEAGALNANTSLSNTRYGSVGLVVGATVNLKSLGLEDINGGKETLRTPILAPGFGYQGASLSEAKRIFGNTSADVIYTVSRSALRNGLASVSETVNQDSKTLRLALSE
jgi:orotidine-5'-phosphate decarboxylase